MYKQVVLIIAATILLVSCHSRIGYISEDQFIGKWKPEGNVLYDGMVINIKREGDQLKGYVQTIPQNKYGTLFVSHGDLWIKKIKRTSNFQFKISQARIAASLLSSYDVSTTDEYKVQFISLDTIGLSSSSLSPLKSSLRYVRQ